VVRRTRLLQIAAACALTALASARPAVADGKWRAAPVNPEFVAYQRALESGSVPLVTPRGHALGAIPSPIDMSYLKGRAVFPNVDGLPATYDLRTKNKVSPVQDQGQCGSCWSFAAMQSLQSRLLPAENLDFSEWHMCKYHGYDLDSCDGGNVPMATAYLTRWAGPVDEEDSPYPYFSRPSVNVLKHVQNVYWLPDRTSPTDNNTIKKALMKYGALYLRFQVDWGCFNEDESTYYAPYEIYNAGHGVACVGWDDTFSKDRFRKKPPANGAFIAKNSWGESSGENGYFYISYYDENMGIDAAFNSAESTENYSAMYQYDPLGLVDFVGSDTTSGWIANIFAATSDSKPLTAVATYAAVPKTKYKLFIYTDVTSTTDPRAGTLVHQASGAVAEPGYRTIKLSKPINLPTGKKFSLVLYLQTPDFNYPLPLEYYYPGYSSRAKSKPGESFASEDGVTWDDVAKLRDFKKASVCVRGLTAE